MERFEHFLKHKPEDTNKGLISMDSSHKVPESEIKEIISRLARQGSREHRADHIIPVPIFMQSHLQSMIQLADMVAYVVYKYYKGDPMFKDWFERLKSKMYRPNGRLDGYGIKEFPKI